ncbi:MAG: 3'-5' exonuclease [Deltaproteobacteria bacterium]|nr:3'-5' exonuclease [Deltaproteobacteria bacterium]
MTAWHEQTWLCIDSETTGLDPQEDRLVELAAIEFRGGQVLRRMGMLLNPGRPIPADATAVHGITDADVADCPSFDEVAERFLKHVRQAEVLVGYNWPFDAAFLAAATGERWEGAIAGKPIIDGLVLVRFDEVGRFWKGAGRHKLDAVAERLGIPREGQAHRASSDCVLTCRVLWQLREHLPDHPGEAAELIRSSGEQQERDFQAWRATQKTDE